MIPAAVVAERFASSRPDYRLLACEPAGLPFFVVNAPALLLQRRRVAPLDEFVMRAISIGVRDQDEVASLLGVDDKHVERSLTRLWQQDLVDVPMEGGGRRLRLLSAGEQALASLEEITPEQHDIWFAFDRLRWAPVSQAPFHLVRPKEAQELGLRELPPRREARPGLDDLPISKVNRAVKSSMRGALGDIDVLVLQRVDRCERKLLPCHLLIFESEDGRDHVLEVAVDGRIQPDIGAALEASGGVGRLGISFEPPAAAESAEAARVVAASAPTVALVSLAEVDAVRRQASWTDPQGSIEGQATSGRERDGLTGRPAALEAFECRSIDTFEHPAFFEEARQAASNRLLLISAWVKNSVVTKAVMDDLYALARRGVFIHIGYGITPDAEKCDPRAIENLRGLASRYPNVVVGLLGFTHAKLLIWDNNQITTSFNWLSFRGDQDRTYRQELGTYLRNHATEITRLYDQQKGIIELAAGKSASKYWPSDRTGSR